MLQHSCIHLDFSWWANAHSDWSYLDRQKKAFKCN